MTMAVKRQNIIYTEITISKFFCKEMTHWRLRFFKLFQPAQMYTYTRISHGKVVLAPVSNYLSIEKKLF